MLSTKLGRCLPLISENNIRCFIRVASTHSFTKAAKDLYITQQACSKNIKSMEESFGFPLFVRNNDSVDLTPAGEKMLHFFLEVFVDYNDLLVHCRELTSAPQMLRLGVVGHINSRVLLSIIARMKEDPLIAVEPELKSAEPFRLLEMVRSGVVDIAITPGIFIDEPWKEKLQLQSRKMMDCPCFLEIYEHSSFYNRDTGTIDFARASCAVIRQYGQSHEDTEAQGLRELQRANIPCSNIRVFNTFEDALMAIRIGQCFILRDALSENVGDNMVPILLKGCSRPIHCYYYDKGNPRIKHCVDLLCSEWPEAQ